MIKGLGMESDINFIKKNIFSKRCSCLMNNVSVFIDDNIPTCRKVHDKLEIPTYVFTTRYNENEERDLLCLL